MSPVRREVVDPGVAVAVGNVNGAVVSEGDVRRLVERLAAELLGRLVGRPQSQEQLTVAGPLSDGMVADIRRVYRVVGAYEQVVSRTEYVLASGLQNVSVPVQHDHGVVAAIVRKNPVVAVHADSDHVVPLPPVGQLSPTRHVLVYVLSVAHS